MLNRSKSPIANAAQQAIELIVTLAIALATLRAGMWVGDHARIVPAHRECDVSVQIGNHALESGCSTHPLSIEWR